MNRRLHFLIPGDMATRTGGYLYDRQIMAGLATLGWRIELHGLNASFPLLTPAALRQADAVLAALPERALPCPCRPCWYNLYQEITSYLWRRPITMKNQQTTLLLATAALLASPAVLAFEGAQQYPLGAENFMAGALPPPGNYFINYFGYYRGDYRHNDSNKNGVKVNATFDALRYIYVSNYKLLGGDWGMHAIIPLVSQHLTIPAPNPFDNDRVFGLGDITLDPLIIGWRFPPDWHITVGLDINLPTGKWDEDDPTQSIGSNFWSFEPIFSFTYLNQSGFEVSAKLMYNLKTENDDTNYQSGDDFHMDYLIGQHFGPWAVGLGGYYLKQTEDDERNGQTVADGNRAEVFALGPAVKYDYRGMSFIGTWNHETRVENYFEGDKFYFKFITAF